ncbi:MAG: hypothetical protein GXP29_10605, partial [Planctomycetes bacterium]|nr:hypothetical protein [Planctomycetota bacterium]
TDQQPGHRQIVDAARSAVEAGTGRVRYTFETPMVVNDKLSLTTGLNEPFVRNRKTTKDGRTNSQVNYEQVGCKIDLRTKWIGSSPEEGVHMFWSVELSDLVTQSGVLIVDDLDAPLFVSQRFTNSTIVVPGETIAFRAGVQRVQSDDVLISVIIARVMATQPKSLNKSSNK